MIQKLIQASHEEHDCEVVAYGMDVIGSGLVDFVILIERRWEYEESDLHFIDGGFYAWGEDGFVCTE